MATKTKRKLKRAGRTPNVADERGTVQVKIVLVRPGGGGYHVPGNIIRSVSVADATVGLVAEIVTKALFPVWRIK